MSIPTPSNLDKQFGGEDKLLQGLSDKFAAEVDRIIKDIEKRVKVLMSEYVGQTGKGVDIEFALTAKTQLERIMRDAGYYKAVDNALKEYSGIIKEVRDTYGMFGAGVRFTDIDRRVISEIIKTDVAEFRDLAKDVQTQIYRSLTDSVLGGVDIAQGVDAVGIALKGTDLAKHAYTYINTAYMNFNRRINNIAAENTGWKQYIYMGPLDEVTRPFCREHLNKVMREDAVKTLRNDLGGSAWADGGGFSCRHRWVAVPPEYAESDEYADLRSRTEKEEQALD